MERLSIFVKNNLERNENVLKEKPTIIHTTCKRLKTGSRFIVQPFDSIIYSAIRDAAKEVASKIPGCKLVYVGGNSVDFFIPEIQEDWLGQDREYISAWVSVNMSVWFKRQLMFIVYELGDVDVHGQYLYDKFAYDALWLAETYNLDADKVQRYFLNAQYDTEQNAFKKIVRAFGVQEDLKGKKQTEIKEWLKGYAMDFDMLASWKRLGVCLVKKDSGWSTDKQIPVFIEGCDYFNAILGGADNV